MDYSFCSASDIWVDAIYIATWRFDFTQIKGSDEIVQDLDRKNANKNSQLLAELEKRDKKVFLLCNYIEKQGAYPPTIANNVESILRWVNKFEALKQKMKQAKKFIF